MNVQWHISQHYVDQYAITSQWIDNIWLAEFEIGHPCMQVMSEYDLLKLLKMCNIFNKYSAFNLKRVTLLFTPASHN